MAQHRNALPTCVSYRRPEVSRRDSIPSSHSDRDYGRVILYRVRDSGRDYRRVEIYRVAAHVPKVDLRPC